MAKKLNFAVYCKDCVKECEPTETGIICLYCGGYISDEELNEIED